MNIAPHTPVIAGEWRLLFKPEKTGWYINDHALFRAADGSWHLIGITAKTKEIRPYCERYFAHGSGPSLIAETGFEERQEILDYGEVCWAPSAVWDGRRYYLFYGPDGCRLAVSDELEHFRRTPVTLLGCPIDGCIRDHMVIQVEPDTWLMYATSLRDRLSAISVFISNDLVTWRFVRYALRTTPSAPIQVSWGATESPFVVRYDDWYYLLTTYTDSGRESYHNTLVFRSQNPFDFGVYTGENESEVVVARLSAHAPEIVRDPTTDQWYITTCGWYSRGIPIEGAAAIAPLRWVSETDRPATAPG